MNKRFDGKSLEAKKFTLSDIPNFPYDAYTNQIAQYLECERWFTGSALDVESSTSTGASIELYPLKINPILSTVLKHAYILFGENVNDGRPLVIPKLVPENKSEAASKRAEEAEEALNYVWWENNGRALMFENGTISQIYGGCVFRATFVPWEWDRFGGWRKIPIRIERVNPKAFIGRPSAGDMFRLKEGWITSDLDLEEALKWGYTGTEDRPTFAEYWSATEHKIWINDMQVEYPLANPEIEAFTNKENASNGTNPFGFVPIVYIPHIRTGGFYGINAFDHLKGIIKEMNLRFGDYGDAVNDDSHVPIAMRNVNGSPQVRRIADGIKILDLGNSANITGSESQPDIFEVHKTRASTSMQQLLGEIIDQYRRDSFVPAVAEGEDEGSQRSALTLATRFWPLTSHAGIERIYYGSGLDVFNSYLLKMMATKEIMGITEAHTKMRIKESWAPMLPRDREAEVQEWAQRAQNNLGSIEHLIEMTRDVDDISEERERILKWMADIKKIETDAAIKVSKETPRPAPFGNAEENVSKDPNNKEPGRPKVNPEKTSTEKVGGGGGK